MCVRACACVCVCVCVRVHMHVCDCVQCGWVCMGGWVGGVGGVGVGERECVSNK